MSTEKDITYANAMTELQIAARTLVADCYDDQFAEDADEDPPLICCVCRGTSRQHDDGCSVAAMEIALHKASL